jgi:hypothetical protein
MGQFMQQRLFVGGAAVVALGWASPAAAIYKCTDPKTGQVTYRDAACPSSSKDPKIIRSSGAAVPQPVAAASMPASAASASTVVAK